MTSNWPRTARPATPLAPAKPSPEAKLKKARCRTAEGLPIHSFTTPIAELGTLCRNLRHLKTGLQAPAFQPDSEPTQIQQRVFDLIDEFPVPGTAQR